MNSHKVDTLSLGGDSVLGKTGDPRATLRWPGCKRGRGQRAERKTRSERRERGQNDKKSKTSKYFSSALPH